MNITGLNYIIKYRNKLREFLNSRPIELAVVLNFNRRVKSLTVESCLNHLHACVNRKLLGSKTWTQDETRVRFFSFVEQGSNQTHVHLVVDTNGHLVDQVRNLIESYWCKITEQKNSKSAVYIGRIEKKTNWISYSSKQLMKNFNSHYVYY
jgi:hypothetical protein